MSIFVKCEPCMEEDKEASATAWCNECQEALCRDCEGVHKRMKMLKHHRVVDMKKMNSIGNTDNYCMFHSDHKIDLFCVLHEKLCCSLCRTEHHQSCENMQSLEIASKVVKKSDRFNAISKCLYSIVNAIKTIKKSQEKNIQRLKNEELNIIKEIGDIKQRWIDQLNKLEKDLIGEVTKKKEGVLSEIQSVSQEAEKLDATVKDDLGKIKFIKNYGTAEQALIFSQKMQSSLCSLKNNVSDIISKCKYHNIVFDKSPICGVKLPDVFGHIDISSKSVQQTSPTSLRQQTQGKSDVRQAYHASKLKQLHKFEVKPPGKVHGLSVTEEQHLLICNYDAKLLIRCDINGNVLKQYQMKNSPSNVALIPATNRAVVTLPEIKAIEFIDVDNLTTTKTIQLPGEGRGISATSERIVIGGVKTLFICNTEGQHIQSVNVKSSFSLSILYVELCPDDTIIYTDIYKVYRVSSEGNPIWEFSSQNLKTPEGVTTDKFGRIYIVDKDSNTVVRLYGNGLFQEIVLTKKDGLDCPYAICFSPTFDKLFVSNKHGRTINVFRYISE